MQKWEYLFIILDFVNNTSKPRWENASEIADWENGPSLFAYANRLGEQGWEIVGSPYTYSSDANIGNHNQRVIFKRPKA